MESENSSASKEVGDLCRWLTDKGYMPELFSFLLKKANADWFGRCCEKHECFLISCCLKKLLDLAIVYANDTDESYNVISYLDRILEILRDADRCLQLEEQESVLNVIYNFWDCTLEAVCYTCVHMFDSLIKIHLSSCKACRGDQCQWILEVKKLLFQSPLYCSSRFRCILSFVKNFHLSKQIPVEIVVEAYSCLTKWSHNSAAKELIVFDLAENLSSTDRCCIHKYNILTGLRSEDERPRLSIVERLLPAMCKEKQLIEWLGTDLITSVPDCTDEYSLYAIMSLAKTFLCYQKKVGGDKCWQDIIGRNRILCGLVHSKSYIRLSAWMVLTEDRKLSKPFCAEEMNLIRVFLLSNFAEQSPASRQKILAGLKKIFIRINVSSIALEKADCSADILNCYENFICWLKDIAFNSLEKGANFNRRLMALNILYYIYVEHLFRDQTKRGFFDRVKGQIRLSDSDLCHLIECFDDSYQLCQSYAYSILTASDFRLFAPFDTFDFENFFKKTFQKVLSIRSLNTDASGNRLRFLLLRFPTKVSETFDTLFSMSQKRLCLVSESLLNIATEDGFLHSVLNGLEVAVSCIPESKLLSGDQFVEWETRLLHNLPHLCFKVVSLVSPVVQALSPEGFLPEPCALFAKNEEIKREKESIQKGDFTQFLVACCWRAHKAVTEIFHTLIKKLPLEILNEYGFIEAVGKFYQEQLTICRHCGAFGCVVNGFEELCEKLWSSSLRSMYCSDLSIPDGWLQEILDIIEHGGDDNFCSARRSAGLPHLVCSLLCTEPEDRGYHSLKRTLTTLFHLEKYNAKIQVHCINILRKLFAESRLSEKISWALEEALHKCITFYASPQWLLRNACAQLFAVLLNQIFGVFVVAERSCFVPLRNRMSAYKFFLRFSSIEALMFQQLSNSCNTQGEFKIFPVLTLLTHLYPSPLSGGNLLSKYIFPILNLALKCKNEKLRRLSVAALDAVFLVHWCANKSWSDIKQNQINTLLLMLSYFIEHIECSNLKKDIAEIALKILVSEKYKNWCNYNLGQFLELLLLCWESEKDLSPHVLLDSLHVNKNHLSKIRQGSNILYQLFSKVHDSNEFDLDKFQSILAADQFLNCLFWNELSENNYNIYSSNIFQLGFNELDYCDDLTSSKILDVIVHVIADADSFTVSSVVSQKMNAYLVNKVSKSEYHNDYVCALKFLFLDENYWDIDWMRKCARSEDFNSRRLVFKIVRHLLKRGLILQDLIEVTGLFLQDDEASLREEVSLLLSRVLRISYELCPQLMLWLILLKFPTLSGKVLQASPERNDDQFFDPCAANVYAESRAYGMEYISDVEGILGHIR